jgi:tRNA (cytidine32/guanosine34-2'-O)-methyltransferase
MAPIKGTHILQGDITRKETSDQILKLFGGNKADIVVCDGAPDVTGFHELDQYLQAQLVLAALNITTQLIRKGGSFVAKIFRGKEINFLYAQCKVFFTDVYCAKPKSSRNSSYEAFIVCRGYKFEKDAPISLAGEVVVDKDWESTVKFVNCGDMSEFDSDKSYSLGESDFKDPVQPPIHPPYEEAKK